MRVDVLTAERPTWRGLMHFWAFLVAIPAGIALIVLADSPSARVAVSIYVASLLLVFGTSAAYHRLAHSYRARRVMQRLDHSMIYLLIAGSYAPICLVALPRAWGIPMMAVVGAIGLFGVILKATAFQRMAWVSYALYLVMGWVAVIAAPVLIDHTSTIALWLILGGGLAYTIGFPVLMVRRPDPWPTVFGYHEVWHGCTVLAAALHFGAVAFIVTA